MNLADAIRKASQPGFVPPEPFASVLCVPAKASEHVTVTKRISEPTEATNAAKHPAHEDFVMDANQEDLATGPFTTGPGLIRLELFLPAEQVDRLIRSVVATQHTVMTLREAASHLRISPARLEEMASERRIPAFQVDGRWRFSRAHLEEWISQNEMDKEQIS
jgi:excisionase family DNA binding protein